jgi:hypothetical protein
MSEAFDEHEPELEALEPAVEHALSEALRAAWAPSELDPARNALLIQLALEDPLAPPSEEEIVESERLRRALEGQGRHSSAELARALSAALGGGQLPDERLAQHAARATARARRTNVVFVVFGAAAAAAALAASLLLVVRPASERADESATMASTLKLSRSTAPLFEQKFSAGGHASTERIDRIAVARGRELRQNRYASWGVR